MTIETICELLAWCTVINFGMLMFWFVILLLARDSIYRLHGNWFKLSRESFDTIHYGGIAFYKICILVFNLFPYLVLRIMAD
jgi:hypothetical protein